MDLHFPKLMTGGSLESLFYSFITETPIIISSPYIPFELETIEFMEGFKLLGFQNTLPITKVQLWDRLAFVLSMGGLIMMPNGIKNVRQENKKIIFSLRDNTRMTVAFDRITNFDKHLDGDVDVYDWFDIRSGSKTDLEELSDTDTLVSRIIFYDSIRVGQGGKGRKDLVAFSRLKKEHLLDYESSPSYVRLKTLQMMKDAGMRGKPNGYNKRGLQLHYALKIEHTHRDIIKKYKPKYKLNQIFKLATEEKEIWNLTRKLLHQRVISILQESSRLQVKV